jgi:hypothetical protein
MTKEADRELVEFMQAGTRFALARSAFHHAAARIEQAEGQARPLNVMDRLRLEFDAIRRIAAALIVEIDPVNPDNPYQDCTRKERICDYCEQPYHGPGVYCSLRCVEADR